MINAPFTIVALEPADGRCHRHFMTRPTRSFSRAGGSLLAISIIVGTVAGTIARQPTIGFLVGLAAGLVMLGYVFLADRKDSRSADAAAGPNHAPDNSDV